SSLAGGGVERIATIMAEEFRRRGHLVAVVTLSGQETDFYRLPRGVHRIALGLEGKSSSFWGALTNNWTRLVSLRQAIRSTSPTVVISFIDQMNVLVLLGLRGTHLPV